MNNAWLITIPAQLGALLVIKMAFSQLIKYSVFKT